MGSLVDVAAIICNHQLASIMLWVTARRSDKLNLSNSVVFGSWKFQRNYMQFNCLQRQWGIVSMHSIIDTNMTPTNTSL